MSCKTLFAFTALAVAGMTAAPLALARGNCRQIFVQAVNKTGKTIKVIDMDYMISGYGRKSEPVPNQIVPRGRIWSMTHNLERANERNTRIIVKYRVKRHDHGPFKWSHVFKKESAFRECKRGRSYSVVLTQH